MEVCISCGLVCRLVATARPSVALMPLDQLLGGTDTEYRYGTGRYGIHGTHGMQYARIQDTRIHEI